MLPTLVYLSILSQTGQNTTTIKVFLFFHFPYCLSSFVFHRFYSTLLFHRPLSKALALIFRILLLFLSPPANMVCLFCSVSTRTVFLAFCFTCCCLSPISCRFPPSSLPPSLHRSFRTVKQLHEMSSRDDERDCNP